MKNIEKISIVKSAIDETLWPTRCAICDKPGYLLCPSCSRKLPYIDQLKSCKYCGEPFGSIQCCSSHENTIFSRCVSVFFLNNMTGKIITNYKDLGEQRLAYTIAYFISKAINPNWLGDKSLITYIPSTHEAILRRGFDHSHLTAKYVSNLTQTKLIRTFEPPSNKDQRELDRKQRSLNLIGKFNTTNNAKIAVSMGFSTIILIDDVLTTGATRNTACLALKNIGFTNIFCVTFSRTF